MRPLVLALVAVAAAGAWTGARAEVVYLANGSRLVVDGWREDEDRDELVFFVGGGRVSFAKTEVTKIEDGPPVEVASPFLVGPGWTATGVTPPPAPPVAPRLKLAADDAVQRMRALLKQGEALFGDRLLSPAQKTRALQWLDQRWQEMDVAEPLHGAYERGYRALRLAAEAFVALGAGIPEAAARTAAAAVAVRDAEAELP